MNIEEFVNDYLKEHRHDVLLSPYNGLVEFAKAFQEKLMNETVEGEYDYYIDAVYLEAPIPQINHHDRVRVIVLPKDD